MPRRTVRKITTIADTRWRCCVRLATPPGVRSSCAHARLLRLQDHPRGHGAGALALPLGEPEGRVDFRQREAVRDDLREWVAVLRAHEEVERGRHDPRVVVHEPAPLDLL